MELSYSQFGTGPAMIILHGLFGQRDNWLTIARIFSSDYSVYLPDARNHGQSPHSDEFSIPFMCADLYEFMNLHRIEKTILIGHSMGGKVVLDFVVKYPERVEKLIIIDIAPRAYEDRAEHRQVLEVMQQLDLSFFQTRKQLEEALRNQLPEKLVQLALKNSYYKLPNVLDWKLNVDGISKNMPLLLEEVLIEKSIPVPALWIRGGLSDFVSEADEVFLRQKFTRLEIRTIQGASHWVHADKPNELVAEIKNFLNR